MPTAKTFNLQSGFREPKNPLGGKQWQSNRLRRQPSAVGAAVCIRGWTLLLLVSALFFAAPCAARADATDPPPPPPPLWAVDGCPALNPFTAGAPTNTSLTIAVQNASAFVMRGDAGGAGTGGCVVKGAVTLAFKVEAMRLFATQQQQQEQDNTSRLTVSIDIRDILLLELGGVTPVIGIDVASSSGDGDTPAELLPPLYVSIQNVSLQADFCATPVPQLVYFSNINRLPPKSKILVQDVLVTALACGVMPPTFPILFSAINFIGSIILRNGTNITISNIALIFATLSPVDGTVRMVSGSEVLDDIPSVVSSMNTSGGVSSGPEQLQLLSGTATPSSADASFLITDLRVEMQGSECPCGMVIDGINFVSVTLRNATAMTIRRIHVSIRAVSRSAFRIIGVSIFRVSLSGRARLDIFGGTGIVIKDAVVLEGFWSSMNVAGLFMFACGLTEDAAVTVAVGRIVIANVSASSSDSAGLDVVAIRVLTVTRLSDNASLRITGDTHYSLQSVRRPRSTLSTPTALSSEAVEGGISIQGARIEGGSTCVMQITAVNPGTVQLLDQSALSVDGVTVRIDGAFLNNTRRFSSRAVVYAGLLRTSDQSDWRIQGPNTSLTLTRARVEVAHVDAAAVVITAMETNSHIEISGGGHLAVSDVTLSVAKSTVRGNDDGVGVLSYLIWAKQGTATTSADAALVLRRTCQRIDAATLQQQATENTAVAAATPATTSVILGPATEGGPGAIALNLTAGSRYVEELHNQSRCGTWRTATVTATPTAHPTATFTSHPTYTGHPTPTHTVTPTTAAVPPGNATPASSSSQASTSTTHPNATTTTAALLATTTSPTPPPPLPTTPTSSAAAAGQRNDAAQAATSANTLVDRPGALAAVIVCSLIGLGVAVAAIAVVWRYQVHKKQLKDRSTENTDNIVKGRDSAKEGDEHCPYFAEPETVSAESRQDDACVEMGPHSQQESTKKTGK